MKSSKIHSHSGHSTDFPFSLGKKLPKGFYEWDGTAPDNIHNSNQITIQNNIFFDIGYHGVQMLYRDTDHDIMDNVMIRI